MQRHGDSRMRITAICSSSDDDDHYDDPMEAQGWAKPTTTVGILPSRAPYGPSAENAMAARIAASMQPPRYAASLPPPLPPTVPTSAANKKKRTRRMTNSERGKLYRSRRKTYIEQLEQEVDELRQEVQDMQTHGRIPTAVIQRMPPVGSAHLRTIREYFSLFEFGVPVLSQSGNLPTESLLRSSRQATFLNQLADPKMAFGGRQGVHLLLQQWERYSMYHSSLRYELKQLKSMVPEPDPVVFASAVLYVRLTRRTIECVFPHILWNEPLVQRLIGMELEYPVVNTFYFNPEGKVGRYEIEVDFLTGLMKLLGNLYEPVQLIEQALITRQHMIGPMENDERPRFQQI